MPSTAVLQLLPIPWHMLRGQIKWSCNKNLCLYCGTALLLSAGQATSRPGGFPAATRSPGHCPQEPRHRRSGAAAGRGQRTLRIHTGVLSYLNALIDALNSCNP